MKIIKKRRLHRFHPYIKYTKKQKSNNKEIKITLYPFQETCIEWIKTKRHEMIKSTLVPLGTGLGKTPIGLIHCQNFEWNSLWIIPTNLISHHKNEVLKLFGKPIKNNKFVGFNEFSRMESTNPIFFHKFNTIVLDEIHLIKKYTKLSKNLKYLQSKFFIGLSASLEGFDITDIPPFIYLDETKDIYNKSSIKFEPIIAKQMKTQLSINDREAYNQLLKQQNSKCAMVNVNHVREWLSNNRCDILVEFINQIKIPIKLIIFSDFNSTLLKLSFKLEKGTYMRLDTSIPVKKRDLFIKNFENQLNMRTLLINRKIGGIGMDLGFVDIVILSEVAYHQSETYQAIGRMQRIGQTPQNLGKQLLFEFLYENTCESNISQSKIPFTFSQ